MGRWGLPNIFPFGENGSAWRHFYIAEWENKTSPGMGEEESLKAGQEGLDKEKKTQPFTVLGGDDTDEKHKRAGKKERRG